MVRVGIIGFGGIAQAHKAGYTLLSKKGVGVRLVSVCDINPERFKNKVMINLETLETGELDAACYTDLKEMLAKEKLDMVDICLPTPLHAKMAVDMLNRGYHVLSEKPMARTYDDCVEMLKAAKNAKGKLMIGQCLRFYPQYEFLKNSIESNRFGKVLSAFFERLSAPPVWGWKNWFMDYDQAGGCILDMHIHDIDMARYLFGAPKAVSCLAQDKCSKLDIVHTRLIYDNMPVTAVSDWTLSGFPFRHGYRVNFEKAAVIFEQGKVNVYPNDGEPYEPEMENLDGILREIEYFTGIIESGADNLKNPPESAANSVKLVETMRESALHGGKEIYFTEGTL
jgi:predicted dehydrogenase